MPQRPKAVNAGAGLLALVGLIIVARVAYGVIMNMRQDDWNPGARAVFLVLNAFVLLFGLFILLLAALVQRGRLWAWITGIVMLPFTLLFGGIMLLIAVLGHSVPWAGAGLAVASVVALLALTVPRTARAYFVRRPAPQPLVPVGTGYRS
jgi:hypothetical protein